MPSGPAWLRSAFATRVMKKTYLATICFLPLVSLPLYVPVFLFRFPFPVHGFIYLAVYFWVGLIFAVVDLWRSPEPTEKKVTWSVLNIFLNGLALPVYWFVVVNKKVANPALPRTAGSASVSSSSTSGPPPLS